MRFFRLACIIASGALAGAPALHAADPAIDLKGTVAAADGKGLGGARVTLLAAGASDTTDEKGSFRIVAENTSLFRPGRGPRNGAPIGRNIESFDATGRLLPGGGTDGNPAEGPAGRADAKDSPPSKALRIGGPGLSPARTSGAPGGADGHRPLAKSAATVDTLVVTRAGYRTGRFPVAGYRMEFDTLRLEPEADGFPIRKPTERTLTCQGTQPVVELDADMVCDIENDSLHASVYVQSRPVSCVGLAGIAYTAEKAWIRTADGIQPLAQSAYDGGGNHKNDRVSFAWNGRFYSVYHSSFGFGWRACAPPDCMQICKDAECRTVLFDGCGRATCAGRPALKASCARVRPDGSVPGRPDPWENEAGLPDYPLLPCRGDAACAK